MADVSNGSPQRPLSPPARSAPGEVQVDMTTLTAGAYGRHKAAPVCVDETLKKEAMSVEEMSKYCFPAELSKNVTVLGMDQPRLESSAVSSSSSTGSRESSLSDCEGGTKSLTPLRLERKQSERINLKVTSRKISRNGRLSQRWHTEKGSQRVFRLVTGCVPIVEGGRILFASSSRKPEWILPKGGWEADEAMEESAIRESYEEAGVIGILGPLLGPIDYETRKAKKRRLEFEELRKQVMPFPSPGSQRADGPDSKEFSHSNEVQLQEIPQVHVDVSSLKETGTSNLNPVSDDEMARIREQGMKQCDETCSVASDASHQHSHVRMRLFPLYVTEIKSSWPESGRFRKVVEIDDAIQMLESRPELQAALKEVKERNLHILPPNEVLQRPSMGSSAITPRSVETR